MSIGCADLTSAPTEAISTSEPDIAWNQTSQQLTSVAAEQPVCIPLPAVTETDDAPSTSDEFWSFPASAAEADAAPALIALPPIVESPVEEESATETLAEPDAQEFVEAAVDSGQYAVLLPPMTMDAAESELASAPPVLSLAPSELGPEEIEILEADERDQPVLKELSEQEKLLAALLEESSPATTGVLTNGRIDELAKNKIQHAYALASRGGLYVARQELIEVLRMISQAKDAQHGTPRRSVALAAGLRALREAEDFEPYGTQLEAEMNIEVLCASHRTPLANRAETAHLLPRLMMDRYLRYAQLQLALSVAGEPAGSMALHALGKLNSQLGRVEADKHRLADRRAVAFHQAALLAHNQNYLAAHELGVLLATSGHLEEAQQLLQQVAERQPNAVVYRNLARVQQKLGQDNLALANRDYARQLSQQGATGTNHVRWVSPAQFAKVNATAPRWTVAHQPNAQQPIPQQSSDSQIVIPGTRTPSGQTIPVQTIRR